MRVRSSRVGSPCGRKTSSEAQRRSKERANQGLGGAFLGGLRLLRLKSCLELCGCVELQGGGGGVGLLLVSPSFFGLIARDSPKLP